MNAKTDKLIAVYLKQLNNLLLIVFSFYIKRDYYEDQLLYENKLMRQTRSVMSALKKVRGALIETKNNDLIARFEHLYEIIFSLDLLKHRLLDHATFEVCEAEIKNVFQAIMMLLSLPPKNTQKKIDSQLRSSILALEVVFQNTVQFLMADPTIFLFFIRDLISLDKELAELHREFLELSHEN